jgi:hypothetical protein
MAKMPAKQQVLVTKQDFSADKYRLVELNADVEAAIKAGDKCAVASLCYKRRRFCLRFCQPHCFFLIIDALMTDVLLQSVYCRGTERESRTLHVYQVVLLDEGGHVEPAVADGALEVGTTASWRRQERGHCQHCGTR